MNPADPHVADPGWIRFTCDPGGLGVGPDVDWLGGKGASLVRLTRAGLPTPAAFTICTPACRAYFELHRNWPPGLWELVQDAVVRLLAPGPEAPSGSVPRLAVRSGAAVSLPGLLATRLDVEPSGPALRQAITEVFDSWMSPGAAAYRRLRGISDLGGTAVTVQAMFSSQVAGVAFSRDPRDLSAGMLLVEATAQGGARLVAGELTPLSWRIPRADTRPDAPPPQPNPAQLPPASCEAATADEPPLARFERQSLPTLCRNVLRIEDLFGTPVDVEFGWSDGDLTYFQARPIVAGKVGPTLDQLRSRELDRLQRVPRGRGAAPWVRHNLSDSLPHPSPLSWRVWRDFMRGAGGYGTLHRRLGCLPSQRVSRLGFLELVAGRIYADPERLVELYSAGYPLRFDSQALRTDPAALDLPPTRLDLERLDPWFLLRGPFVLARLAWAGWQRRRLARLAAPRFHSAAIPALRLFVDQERAVNLAGRSLDFLLACFERRRSTLFDVLAPELLLPGALGGAAWGDLQRQLADILGPIEGRSMAAVLLAAVPDPVAVRQARVLVNAAEGRATADEVLRELGHRGLNESELASPRWSEQPADLLIQAARDGAARLRSSTQVDSSAGGEEDRLADRLRDSGAMSLFPRLAALWKTVRELLPLRSFGQDELLRGLQLLREAAVEIGRVTALGDGVFHLTEVEWRALPTSIPPAELLADRLAEARLVRRWNPPAVLEPSGPHAWLEEPAFVPNSRGDRTSSAAGPSTPNESVPSGSMPRIAGRGISPGRADGLVVRWDEPSGERPAPPGAVLVARTIPPGALPFLTEAAALVVEQGSGALSHVALLARQLRLPAVVIPEIVGRLREGEWIEVDGDEGWIAVGEPGT